MIPHYLACTDYGATCGHGNTVTPLFLALFGAGLAVLICGRAFLDYRRKQAGLPPKPPRQPADTSPATAALLTGQPQRGYYPRRITALTPSGITVTVRCPHRYGHRTPDHAIACGEAERDRIESTGW